MREIDGKLYSTNAERHTVGDDFVLEYQTGKTMKAKVKGTSLYVFKTYAAANKFAEGRTASTYTTHQVWSCTVTKPTAIVLSDCLSDIRKFWTLKLAKKKYSDYKRSIYGYMTSGACVASLKLIERIS